MYIYQNDILKRSYIRYMWPCSSVWEHIRSGRPPPAIPIYHLSGRLLMIRVQSSSITCIGPCCLQLSLPLMVLGLEAS